MKVYNGPNVQARYFPQSSHVKTTIKTENKKHLKYPSLNGTKQTPKAIQVIVFH